MQTSLQALEFCEKNSITVMNGSLPLNHLLSGCVGSENFIMIDDRQMTESEKKTHLWHEIGHCATGSFYSPYTPLETRSRCESRANRWTVKKLIPKGRMLEAMRNGAIEVWQLAEYFEVGEGLVRFALRYYFNKDV